MKKIKLAGVVVFYKPNEKNIKNIQLYKDSLDYLFVIDNSDDHENRLKNSSKIKYIKLYENKGIAYALNLGAEESIKKGFDWLLTMDQDSILTNKELIQMKKFVNCQNTENIGIVSPWHVINTGLQKPKGHYDYPLEVMTSGNLVNLKIFQKIGGWDELLFIDDVDIDYCMNLHIHGYQVVRLLDVEMEHSLGDITIKHIWPLRRNFVCSNHNYIRRYYMSRNVCYLQKKYHGEFEAYFIYMKNGIKGQIKNILMFENHKYKKIRNIIRGKRDAENGTMGKYKYKN
jgi:rhamnosyltransferase